MKKYISLLFIVLCTFAATAQPGRGIYGTISTYSTFTPTYKTHTGVVTSIPKLSGVDTSYAYWQFATPYYLLFELKTTQIADSLTGTAILQASKDNVIWESITGLTALCTSCIGVSKTYTIATGTTTIHFDVGKTTFPYWRTRIIGTRSTDTTTIAASCIYSY